MSPLPVAFLADLNVSPVTVRALGREGWDIIRVSEKLPPRTSDQDILAFARQEERVVISQDLDFSMLLALSGLDQPSLVTLRLSQADPEKVARRLLEIAPLLAEALPAGCAVTVEDEVVRVRKLPIR